MRSALSVVVAGLALAACSAPVPAPVPAAPPPWELHVARWNALRIPEDPAERRQVETDLDTCVTGPGLRGPCLALLAGIRAADVRVARNEALVLDAEAHRAGTEARRAAAEAGRSSRRPVAGTAIEASSADPDAVPTDPVVLAAAATEALLESAAEARGTADAALRIARETFTRAEITCEREAETALPEDRDGLRACRVAAVYGHAALLEELGFEADAWDVLTRCDDTCDASRPPTGLCLDARVVSAIGRGGEARALLGRCRRTVLEAGSPVPADWREVTRTEESVEPEEVAARDACVQKARPWTVPLAVASAARLGPEDCDGAARSAGPVEMLEQAAFRRRFQEATGQDVGERLRSDAGGKEVVAWYAGPEGQAIQVAFRLALQGFCTCTAPASAGGTP